MAIEQLTPFQHMQSRPDMYISSTESPIHLLYELIDNAADECISGKANKIEVDMNFDTHEYAVSDNGRGIPITSENINGECPIILATTLYSGGKFNNDMYDYHSGLHGVGLAVVNALSDTMTIIVKNTKTKHRKYVFNNSDNQSIKPIPVSKESYSTKVSFKPSIKYFDTLDIDVDTVIERLKGIMTTSNETSIRVNVTRNGELVTKIVYNDLMDVIYSNCDESICVQLKGTKNNIQDTMTMEIGFGIESKSFKFVGIVNTLPISEGIHRKFIENSLMNYMYEKAMKLKKHVEKKDMLVGCNIYCVSTLSDPAFAGQMKYSLTGKADRYDHIFNYDKLVTQFDKYKGFFERWIDNAEQYRMSLDSSRKIKTKTSRNRVSVEDLRDCTSKDINERELYIVEGQSAGGTLIRSRDVKRHAILPLRGKILNVMSASFGKIVESVTLSKIFNTIGIKPNTDVDISEVRYGKVIIASDGDVDGFHIQALLINFFNKFCPILIKEGRLYVAEMPLFGVHDKNKFIPIFDENTLETYKESNCVIHRYKGLGEMDPDELAPCMFDTTTRKLIQITESPDDEVKAIWDNKESMVEDYIKD